MKEQITVGLAMIVIPILIIILWESFKMLFTMWHEKLHQNKEGV
jgi:hypothetical protein